MEFVPMSVEAFKNTRMADFNVLILPDGSAKRYAAAFGKDGVEKITGLVQGGGTLVCVGGAAGFAADKKVNLTGSRVVGADSLAKQDDDTDDDKDEDKGKTPTAKSDKDEKPEGQKARQPARPPNPTKRARPTNRRVRSPPRKNPRRRRSGSTAARSRSRCRGRSSRPRSTATIS